MLLWFLSFTPLLSICLFVAYVIEKTKFTFRLLSKSMTIKIKLHV